jgi:hypothetical protein
MRREEDLKQKKGRERRVEEWENFGLGKGTKSSAWDRSDQRPSFDQREQREGVGTVHAVE